MSHFGTHKIARMPLGDVEIAKAYLGDDLVFQKGGKTETHTVTFIPSGYIPKTTDGSWYSLSDYTNAYTDEDSTTYATIRMTRGASAETWIYFTFDTSSIPANATIDSVSCAAKIYCQSSNRNYVATRECQMFSGTTAKGSPSTPTTSASIANLDVGTWTGAELEDARIRFYGVRGTSNTSTNYVFRFYGATLTVTYTVPV